MARYTLRGNIEIRWLPAAHAFADSTLATLTALEVDTTAVNIQHGPGSDGECISDLGGWELDQSQIPVPDLCSNVTGTIPGEITTGQSYLEYYDDDTSTPTKDLLVEGIAGYVLIMPQGTAVGKKGDVWPVTVQSNRPTLVVGNEAAKFRVNFTTSGPTAFEVVA